MSVHVTNGNGHTNYKDLNDYLSMFQDVYSPVEQAIDQPAYKTYEKHKDLTESISAFMAENAHLFSTEDLDERVSIIFDAYRDAYLEVLKDDENYQKAVELVKESPMKLLGSSDQLEKAVEWLALKRLKIFHSITPAKAIKECLDLKGSLSFTGFPDTYIQRECNRAGLKCFFEKQLTSSGM